jgi:hypothetical protein
MDVASVRIGTNAAPSPGRPKLRDVNGDGWTDLVLRFRPSDAGIARGDSELPLRRDPRPDRLRRLRCSHARTLTRSPIVRSVLRRTSRESSRSDTSACDHI